MWKARRDFDASWPAARTSSKSIVARLSSIEMLRHGCRSLIPSSMLTGLSEEQGKLGPMVLRVVCYIEPIYAYSVVRWLSIAMGGVASLSFLVRFHGQSVSVHPTHRSQCQRCQPKRALTRPCRSRSVSLDRGKRSLNISLEMREMRMVLKNVISH